jgi:hypothetical protein
MVALPTLGFMHRQPESVDLFFERQRRNFLAVVLGRPERPLKLDPIFDRSCSQSEVRDSYRGWFAVQPARVTPPRPIANQTLDEVSESALMFQCALPIL